MKQLLFLVLVIVLMNKVYSQNNSQKVKHKLQLNFSHISALGERLKLNNEYKAKDFEELFEGISFFQTQERNYNRRRLAFDLRILVFIEDSPILNSSSIFELNIRERCSKVLLKILREELIRLLLKEH